MTLKAVDPIDITEAVLTASDIPEPDTASGEVEWEDASFVDLFSSYSVTHRLDSYGTNIIRSGKNGIFVSNDNGISYSNPFTSLTYGCCVDREDHNVMYFTTASAVYKSTDGGANFSLLTIPSVRGILWAVSSMGSRVVVVGGVGVCLVSNDSGSSFSLVSIGAESTKLTDVDINNVYTLACDIHGNVYYSYDNHSSWTKIATGYTGELYSVAHHNGYSFISGQKGFLSVSTDAGTTWTTITTHLPYSKHIYEIATSESGYLCIPGRVSGALVSTDLGATWIEMNGGADQAAGIVTINDECVLSDGYLLGGHISRYPIYRVGDKRIQASQHRKYQCLVAFNQDSPMDGATKDASATWIDIGPTNKWAMFDDKTTTQTIGGAQWSVEFETDRYVDTLAVIGSAGLSSCLIQAWDASESLIYSESITPMDTAAIIGPFANASDDFFYKPSFYVDDLDSQGKPFRINLTFNADTSSSVGAVVFGAAIELGDCISGTRNEKLDYSRQEYDEFGELTYIERPVVNLSYFNVLSDKYLSGVISRFFDFIRKKNTLWIANVGDSQEIITYGRIQQDPLTFDMPTKINYNVTVRGSI
jgi:photosystem II stability/assembly factor-like uncharacterized protein